MAVDVNERVIRCPGMDKPITKNHFRLIMRNEIAGYLEGLSRQTKQAALDVLYEGFIGGSIVESKKPENAECLLTHEEWQNAHKSTYSTPQSV